MLALVVSHSLIVIVEANLLGSQHLEAPHLETHLFGQIDKIFAVFPFGTGIVYYYAVPLLHLLLGYFVAFLLSLKCVAIDSGIALQIILPKGRFSRARSSDHQDHLFRFHSDLQVLSHDQLSSFWNSGRIESLHFDFFFLPQKQILRSLELNSDI